MVLKASAIGTALPVSMINLEKQKIFRPYFFPHRVRLLNSQPFIYVLCCQLFVNATFQGVCDKRVIFMIPFVNWTRNPTFEDLNLLVV